MVYVVKVVVVPPDNSLPKGVAATALLCTADVGEEKPVLSAVSVLHEEDSVVGVSVNVADTEDDESALSVVVVFRLPSKSHSGMR